jgi:hypothetical protein
VNSDSALMVVKVAGLVAAGAAFVWWQFRDLAREKKRNAARKSQPPSSEK